MFNVLSRKDYMYIDNCYDRLQREANRNQDKYGIGFGGGQSMYAIDRGEIVENQIFDERRC